MLTVELVRNIAPTFLKKDSTPDIDELLNTVFTSLTRFPLMFEACSIYIWVWFCKMTEDISRMRTDEHGDTLYQWSRVKVVKYIATALLNTMVVQFIVTSWPTPLALKDSDFNCVCLQNSCMLSIEEDHTEVSGFLSEGAVTEVVLQSMAWQTIRAVWIGWKSRSHTHNFTITVMKRYQHQHIKIAKKDNWIHNIIRLIT